MVKNIQCSDRPNLSEGACQKSCESNQIWGSYGQKETTYFKEAFVEIPSLKQCYYLNYANNIIINMGDIRQERSNEEPTLKLDKRFK